MSQLIRRLLAHDPGAAGLAVGTMIIALGLSTAIFSVVYTTVLRPLPYPAPEQLVVISSEFPSIQLRNMGLSGPELFELETFTRSWARVGAVRFGTATLGGPEPRRTNIAAASAGLLAALGVRPLSGRLFSQAEDRRGADRVALLGHGLWLRSFGADAGAIGRSIDIDGEAYAVVGIMPRGFDLLGSDTELWVPLALDPATPGGRADHNIRVVARLAPGVSLSQARTDLGAAVSRWMTTTGEVHSPAPSFHPLAATPLQEAAVGELKPAMFTLLGAAAFVLLLACANVCNVLLARAEGRRHQLAIRVALGASKRRLLIDHLLEGLCIAGAGCAGGTILAIGLVRALAAGMPALARREEIALDPAALLFAVAAMGACALLFGIAPVLRLDIGRAQRWLHSEGRSQSISKERRRLQHALVACQVAAALMLLSGAGLLLRSFWRLAHVDTGVRVENVLTFQVSLPERRYLSDAQVWAFYDRLLDRLTHLTGVRNAAVMSGRLPERRANNTTFFLEGVPVEGHMGLPQVEYIQHVSPSYFSTLQIPVLKGRSFTAADSGTSQPVAVVNETLARKFWPERDPLGQRLRPAMQDSPWFTVIGVVADVKHAGIAAPVGTELYVAHRQARVLMSAWLPTSLHAVVAADTSHLLAIRQELQSLTRGVDSAAAIANIRLLQDSMSLSIAGPRFLAGSLGTFAAIAVILACVGIYGVVAYGVNLRTTEFGVRTALGATGDSIVSLVLAQAALPIGAGIALGFAGIMFSTRLIASFLYETAPVEPATLSIAVLVLTSVALIACWIPARRAARVDPLIALRDR